MDGINLSSYYDKISQIKARVMNKQRDYTRDITNKYGNQNVAHIRSNSGYSNYSNQYASAYRDRDIYQNRQPLDQKRDRDHNIINRAKQIGISQDKVRDSYEVKKIQQSKRDPSPHVMDRVKELQSVNQKIKQMLANKREPSVSTIQPRTTSSYKRSDQSHLTPKKMTSLFQDQKAIVESKVGPPVVANKEKKIVEVEEYKVIKEKELPKVEQERKSVLKNDQFSIRAQSYLSRKSPQKSKSKYEFQRNDKSAQRQPFSFQLDKKQPEKRDIDKIQTKNVSVEQPNMYPKVDYKSVMKQIPINQVKYFGKGQSKKLVAKIVHQIQLDIKLRQSKQKFSHFKSQDKWKIASDKISSYGLRLMGKDLQSWLTVSNEQCDPFIDLGDQNSFDYDELAMRFAASWESWFNQVKESVTIQGLEKEGFKIQEIDIGSKGYITVEDFVCFINFSSDNFFRNRDVCSMFRRWKKLEASDKLDNQLTYQNFLSFVAK